MNNQNEINWEQARMLSQQQTQRPLTKTEKAMRMQANLEALAASSLSSIIESRSDFTAQQCVDFAFEVADLVIAKAEAARKEINAHGE